MQVYTADSGREMFFGVLQREVDAARLADASPEAAAARAAKRTKAAQELTNIGRYVCVSGRCALAGRPCD